jgi:hypothetical protein
MKHFAPTRHHTIMELHVARLLLEDRDIHPDIREAITQGDTETAAHLLMDTYDLDCAEASTLVDVPICDD